MMDELTQLMLKDHLTREELVRKEELIAALVINACEAE